MLNDQDLVSVIIPTKNRHELVGTAVKSVLDQTYQNVEVIVVDDGSDPPLSLDIGDERLKIIRNDKSVGGGAARNIGLRAAKGHYMSLLDDDDYYYPHKIMCQLDYLKNYPDVDMVFSPMRRDYGDGRSDIFPSEDYQFETLENFYSPNTIHNNSTLFSRRVLERVMFDERLTKFQDWQFNMAVSLEYKVHYLPVCVAVWNRDQRPDRVALQDESVQFANFKMICEIFSDVINKSTRLRRKYYRRLGYLALKSNNLQPAIASFSMITTRDRWLLFAYLLLKSRASMLYIRYKEASAKT
jgi:glycosyltransferase involved in cell wall biosynthesis